MDKPILKKVGGKNRHKYVKKVKPDIPRQTTVIIVPKQVVKKNVIFKQKKEKNKKLSKFNNVSYLKYINTSADLSLTHIFSIKKSIINDILTNKNTNIGIDIFTYICWFIRIRYY